MTCLKSIILTCAAIAPLSLAALNPKANDGAVVTSGNARFTVLTPEMIRIEYSDKGLFEDRATFAIVNRELPVPPFTVSEDSAYLYINTDKAKLKYLKGTDPRRTSYNLNIEIENRGMPVTWYPGKPDPLNLKGTTRTLDRGNGQSKRAEMEDGLISRSGWAVIDESFKHKRADGSVSYALAPNDEMGFDWLAERADPDALDMYFLGYGSDYKKALGDFVKVAGRIPLPPAFVFGYWYSKYQSYTANDFRNIVKQLKDNKIPTDVMILDMAWHWDNQKRSHSEGRGGWTGWTWNDSLIPDPKGLLDDIHKAGLRSSLNLHPADGIGAHESPEYFAKMNKALGGKYLTRDQREERIQWVLDSVDFARAFFDTVIRDHESEGVDFWWLDWQQWKTSKFTPGLGQTFWTNHVFFNDMQKNRPDRRPLIFHRWGGLGSHRYQTGFSGDTFINFPTLGFLPYFTATASNVGYGYWGHDIGGHQANITSAINDPELVLRWIQMGVFTPIFRTHATDDPRIERRIWTYSNFPDMLDAVKLRYALFPYLYTAARKSYDTGIGMVRPLYYEYPDAEEAYAYEDEYFFGDDILVAPIVEPGKNGVSSKRIWFPEGKWYDVSHGKLIEGPATMTLDFTAQQIPWFIREGAVIPLNPESVTSMTEHPAHLILKAVAGSDRSSQLYEDQGDNQDYATVYATTAIDQRGRSITINPRSGSDKGLKTKRSYTLEVLNADAPTTVTINGKKAKEISYDSARRVLKVEIPTTACDKPIEVKY